ncbi:hypothetical protein TNCV_546541 [Trichonephila clavipes]|nr:hypothetical protein TNCV_546541 [Trichonephila clavipes]
MPEMIRCGIEAYKSLIMSRNTSFHSSCKRTFNSSKLLGWSICRPKSSQIYPIDDKSKDRAGQRRVEKGWRKSCETLAVNRQALSF